VVRMFITVIAIFAICWLPYHGYFIYAYHNRSVTFSTYIPHLYLAFYWLAMSNAMVNPIIYYWMNNKFRVYFRQVICFCGCIKHQNMQNEPQSHQVNMEFIRRSKSFHSQKSADWRPTCPVVRQAQSTLKQSVSVLTNIQKESIQNNTWSPGTINSML
ncbi:tachykinin-like peptides receptor 86C, partial [Halyomorpha halys]|uniref:tachykinin-like peptides receptor 86C n=1 Tax=Halyomorpha halys TaxID=286706 RepID=UPI0006D516CC